MAAQVSPSHCPPGRLARFGFVAALNAFDSLLEDAMDLPKGAGVAFCSDIGGGTPYHTREEDVAHWINNPADMLISMQGAGDIFRGMTRKQVQQVVTVLDFIKGTSDMSE